MIICLLATINVWRGLWGVFDFYAGKRAAWFWWKIWWLMWFSGDNNKYLFLMNGFAWKALLLLNCINSLAGREIFKDGEELEGRYVKLPIDYFRNVLKIYEPKSKAIDTNGAFTITRLWYSLSSFFCNKNNWLSISRVINNALMHEHRGLFCFQCSVKWGGERLNNSDSFEISRQDDFEVRQSFRDSHICAHESDENRKLSDHWLWKTFEVSHSHDESFVLVRQWNFGAVLVFCLRSFVVSNGSCATSHRNDSSSFVVLLDDFGFALRQKECIEDESLGCLEWARRHVIENGFSFSTFRAAHHPRHEIFFVSKSFRHFVCFWYFDTRAGYVSKRFCFRNKCENADKSHWKLQPRIEALRKARQQKAARSWSKVRRNSCNRSWHQQNLFATIALHNRLQLCPACDFILLHLNKNRFWTSQHTARLHDFPVHHPTLPMHLHGFPCSSKMPGRGKLIWCVCSQYFSQFHSQYTKTIDILLRRLKDEEVVAYKFVSFLIKLLHNKMKFTAMNMCELRLSTFRKVIQSSLSFLCFFDANKSSFISDHFNHRRVFCIVCANIFQRLHERKCLKRLAHHLIRTFESSWCLLARIVVHFQFKISNSVLSILVYVLSAHWCGAISWKPFEPRTKN